MNRVLPIIIAIAVSSTGCNHTTNSVPEVSLLKYADQTDLDTRGLTKEKIDMLNQAHIFEYDYPRYEGYELHEINDFDILVNKSNPNELYVFKNGKLLLDVDDDLIRLYKKGTTYPNPADTSVYFSPERPAVMVADDDSTYYDLDLDGPDIASTIIPYTGDYKFNNYEDVSEITPSRTISKAFIKGLRCEPLYVNIACCLNENERYDVYNFIYDKGWSKVDNSKGIYAQCNSGDIEKTRKELVETIYGSL